MIVLVLVVRIDRRLRPIVDVDRRKRIGRVVRRLNERFRIAFVAFRKCTRRCRRFVRRFARDDEIARARAVGTLGLPIYKGTVSPIYDWQTIE